MANEQIRSRTVGTKMTESEYARLAAIAEGEDQSPGEWCREVLLERIEARKPTALELTLLGEVLALRTIVLNIGYRLAEGDKLTSEEMDELIERADREKTNKAADRFADAAKTCDGLRLLSGQ